MQSACSLTYCHVWPVRLSLFFPFFIIKVTILRRKSLLTYLLTPCCRVLLEKLTGLQLVKKFPAFYGTRRLITALTSVRHLSLSWASTIHSKYPHPTSWRSIIILSTHNKRPTRYKILKNIRKITIVFNVLLYILESIPHPNLIRTSFCRFLKRKKKLACGSNPHLSSNRPLPTRQIDSVMSDDGESDE